MGRSSHGSRGGDGGRGFKGKNLKKGGIFMHESY